ncbi:MAG: sulfatase, partial [Oligoflexia bacterium]|nr:sulfatase [Oligoflexia bacterium]
MLGIEELTNLAIGRTALSPQDIGRLLVLYLVFPALLGLAGAGCRCTGGRVLATTAGLGTVIAGAIATKALADRGAPLSALFGFGGAGVVALVACRTILVRVTKPRARWALAAAAIVFLSTFRAISLNAIGSPTDHATLVADGLALAVSALAGVVAAILAPALRKAPLALLAAGLPGLLAIAGRIALTPAPPTPAIAADKPDVLLVVVDTLRADHLGVYGYPRPTTPGVDALAARGLRYADATSAAPWTLASFASLATGLEPAHHGAGVNTGEHNTHAPLSDLPPTLSQRLSEAGYRTGAIVSNPYLNAKFGLDRGYDLYDDALGLGHMMALVRPLDRLPFEVMTENAYRLAPRMVRAAQKWWAATAGGPRFLMLHLMDPHKPYNAPKADRRAVVIDSPPPSGPGSWQDPIERLYDAEIHFADRSLMPFVEQALADGATVIFTADHGQEWGDHTGAYPGEDWPVHVHHGHTLYQEQLHVPLIIAGPNIPTGTIDRPVRSLDVVSTILSLAGADPMHTDGQPLAEVLGQAPPPSAPRRAQAILFGTEKRSVIGPTGLKLIRSRYGDELYDLAADPG